jgi:hypothetical protein
MYGSTTTTSRAANRFVLLAGTGFAILYVVARTFLERSDLSTPIRVGVALLPVPAFALLILSIIRGIRAMDELEKRIQLEALAVAFPLALVLVMTLGLLQLAVPLSPHDWSYRHVWPFLYAFYAIGLAIARNRYR